MSSPSRLRGLRISRWSRLLFLTAILASLFTVFAIYLLNSANLTLPSPEAYGGISVKGLDGEGFTLDSFKGRVVVLEFMATWCTACAQQVPIMVEFASKYSSGNVTVISVSIDPGFDTPDILKNHNSKKGITWLTGRDATQGLTRAFEVKELPTIVVFRPDGSVDRVFIGVTDFETLSKAVAPLLPQ